MKKVIVIATVISAFAVLSSCGRGSASLKTESDSVSYAIVAANLEPFFQNVKADSTIDYANFIAAVIEVVNEKSKMSPDSANAFLREYFMVRKPAQAKAEGEKFLAEVEKENKNIVKTESGLMYEIIEGGDPNIKATNDEDKVKVVYEGKLKNGKVFDSSIERGDTAEFALNRVIKGWTEGMKLVGKGGKIKLWVPAELGYGAQPSGAIGPNEPLVFDVTIVDVIPAEATK